MDRAKQSVVLAKIEGTKGSDSSPAAATEALVTKGEPTLDILSEGRERGVPLSTFGKVAPVNVGTGLKLNFTTELKGSGAAGTASRYGCLFRACNFTEVVNASTSVVYTPNSTQSGESVSLYFWAGGTQHIILGAVGTVKFNFISTDIQTAEWEFTGLYASDHASDVSFPAITHETIAPLVWKAANFVYNSESSLVVPELTLDIGNVISPKRDGNASTGISEYFVSDRLSKGTMKIEKEALSTLNPWTIFNASTQANLETKPTGTAGNIIEVEVVGATLEPPKYESDENKLNWDLSFSIDPTVNVGNNEIVVTFK